MSRLGLLACVASLAGACGVAVVGDRCPGLAECDPAALEDGGADGEPVDLTLRLDATSPAEAGAGDGDAGRLDGRAGPADGTPAADASGAPGDGPPGADASGALGDGPPGADALGVLGDGPPAAADAPCPAGAQLCAGQCTAVFTDPDNCGSCGHVCQSGICLSGVCQDAGWGHLVLLGHDFTQPGVNERRELASAALLPLATPVRLAVYREYASDESVQRALAALVAEAAQRGRALTTTVHADRASFTAALGGVDAALIVAQDEATDDSLGGAADELQASLLSLVRSGRVLVVLDAPPTTHAGTWQLVRGLTTVTGVVDVTAAHVAVTSPADAVAIGLTATYRAAARSAAFTYDGPGEVARTAAGPVLVHEIVPP